MAKSILVVDYDPKRIEVTTRPFTQAGYAVEVARDGVEGVEAFARLHPDLVLVEMMLPKRHGFEVCQELRKLRPSNRTPVLILGSTQAERYRLQAIGAGANDYLVRPIDGGRLLEICTNLLEQPNQDLPPAPVEGERRGQAIEDSLPDFFEDPSVIPAAASPDTASESFLDTFLREEEATPFPAGPVELGDLSDDDIMARLDAILPTEPGLSSAQVPVQVPEPISAPRPLPAPAPQRAIEPPVAKEVPAEPARPPKPKAATPPPERPAPRARLPQAEPVLEAHSLEAQAPRRTTWPVLAIVAAVALVGGFYAWRAVTADDESSIEAATLDAGDFARVRPAEPEPLPPAPVEEAQATVAEPVVVDSAPVRLPEPTPKPVAKTTETPGKPVVQSSIPAPSSSPTPSPTPIEPTPSPKTTAPIPAPSSPVAQAPVPSLPPLESLAVKSVVPEVSPPAPKPATEVIPGSIVDLSKVDAPPIAESRALPVYPRLALRMRREGRVTLRVLVDENGFVADVAPTDASAGAEFEGAAMDAVRQWRYRPARKEGIPVKVWLTEVVAFKL